MWVGGEVRRASEAVVPASERALRYGDGCFVTLSARGGRLLDAAAQLERLAAGCRVLGLDPPPETGSPAALSAVLVRLGWKDERCAVVRVQVSAGSSGRGYARPSSPGAWALVEASDPPPPRRLSLAICPPELHLPPPALPGVKSCSALPAVLAAEAARRLGVHEVVRVDAGRLTEASSANLFWLRGGVLYTPAAELPLYAGVTRERTLEAAQEQGMQVREDRFPPSALADAEAVFLTNAVRGVEPVRRLDGRSLAWPAEARSLARGVATARQRHAHRVG